VEQPATWSQQPRVSDLAHSVMVEVETPADLAKNATTHEFLNSVRHFAFRQYRRMPEYDRVEIAADHCGNVGQACGPAAEVGEPSHAASGEGPNAPPSCSRIRQRPRGGCRSGYSSAARCFSLRTRLAWPRTWPG